MIYSVLMIIVSAFIAFFEWPMLKDHKKDKIFFFTFLAISTVITIIKINNIQIPNPLDGIYKIYKPVGSFFIEKILS